MMYRTKKLISFLVTFGVLLGITVFPAVIANEPIDLSPIYLSVANQVDSKQAFQYVEKLCSDEFEGRQTGTEGANKASLWIANLMEGFGLEPAYQGNDGFYQSFKAPCFNLQPEVSFMLTTKSGNIPYVYKQDFVPSPGSGSGSASGAISFVGYGITNENLNYDDYQGIDVTNKIVMMLRKGPISSTLNDADQFFATKIANAKNHGAIGVIIVEKEGEKNPYSMQTKAATGSINNDVPAIFIPTSIANQILEESAITIKELQEEIEVSKVPHSISVKAGAYIKVNMSYAINETRNVIGVIPAEDPSVEQSILVTAHYDHLGRDLVNGDLYPGANDNASGVASLLETARVLTSNCYIPSINIVFIAFSGEEEGLLGSAYYVDHPLFPLKKIVAVLNMDMVGTGTGNIYAGTSFKELIETIENAADVLDKEVPISKSLMYGGSDQLYFAKNNVPSVFFIRSNPTGIGSYHTPQDTVDTVDANNLKEQTQLIIMIVSFYTYPKILVFDTTSDYWFHEKSLHRRIQIKAKGSAGVTGKILDSFFSVPENGSLEKVVELKEGQNLIQIQILSQVGEIVLERLISISATIDPNLDGDLTYDKKVDLSDLLVFSKVFPSTQIKNSLEELCDINQDQVVDEKDFNILKKSYDYQV